MLIEHGDWVAPANTYRCAVHLLPESGCWSALAATLPGAASQGDTIEQALANVREALEAVLASYSHGQIPWVELPPTPPGVLLRWVTVEGLAAPGGQP